MQLHRTAAVLATAVIAAGMGAGSAHATTGTTAEVDHTKSVFVAVGKLDSFQGNRHQVVLNTAGGSVKSTSRVKSYYCPPGASITASWVSSKCVLRSTHSIRFVDGSPDRPDQLVGPVREPAGLGPAREHLDRSVDVRLVAAVAVLRADQPGYGHLRRAVDPVVPGDRHVVARLTVSR